MLKKIGIGLAIVLLVVALVGFFVVLPLGLMGVGAYRAVKQDRMIRSAVPVEVQVTWSQVRVKGRSRKSTTYQPDVQYKYVVDGTQYAGSAVTPLDDDGSLAWAQEVTRQYRLLSRHTAWHVPGAPERAFLIKRYSGGPYGMYYFGVGLVAFFMTCGAGFLFVKQAPAAAAPEVKDGRWTRLGLSRTLRARAVVNVVQGLVVLGLTGWAAWHYYARFGGTRGWAGAVAAVAFVLWGLLFFYFAWRARTIGRAVSDVRVLVEAEELRPGRTARVRVQQDVGADVNVEELKVGLICTRTVGDGKNARTETQWEHWHAEASPRAGAMTGSGSLLAARLGLGPESRPTVTVEAPVAIPSEQPPTRTASGANPRFEWKLVVRTAIADCPDYEVEFPVTVLPEEGRAG